MPIVLTEYYPEFLRYFDMARKQQDLCNTSREPPYGMMKHEDSGIPDDLMRNVHLYDVVERKYAGFSQIINDCFYGWEPSHPYWKKMEAGVVPWQREDVAKNWTGKHQDFDLPEWLYVFILHRVCGSAINYSTKPSGYHNTVLFELHKAKTIEGMVKIVNHYPGTFYTSIGYQFPAFPKIPEGSKYKRGGDYYLTEYAPGLARDLAEFLQNGPKKDLREVGEFMFEWNGKNDLNAYRFQYAAVIADIADWLPGYVNRETSFYYGSNARECIKYLAEPTSKTNEEEFLDEVMERIFEDTESVPYNAEDVCCDFIRYMENYVKPGSHYDHLDFDAVFSSSKLVHPYGRQRAMLELGLVKTFNGMKSHPSDDRIIKEAGLTEDGYRARVRELESRRDTVTS